MRERLRDKERLEHILEAIANIQGRTNQYWEEAIDNDPIAYYGNRRNPQGTLNLVCGVTTEDAEGRSESLRDVRVVV